MKKVITEIDKKALFFSLKSLIKFLFGILAYVMALFFLSKITGIDVSVISMSVLVLYLIYLYLSISYQNYKSSNSVDEIRQ